MNYQTGFELFKESTKYIFKTPDLSDVLFVLLGFVLAVGVLILLPYYVSRRIQLGDKRKNFFDTAYSLGLTKDEVEVLWSCARKLSYDPTKFLLSKPVFERCVSFLVRKDPSTIDLINRVRKKLHFDRVPWFLPLTTTRELDMYQTGFLTIGEEVYDAAVWEKDEARIHIALLGATGAKVKVGDKIKFSFLREDEGRYYFSADVLEVYHDANRPVVVVEHTDKLNKIQLREHPRWRVNVPAKLYLFRERIDPKTALMLMDVNDVETIEGRIEDISIGGLRFCAKYIPEVFDEQVVVVIFDLDQKHMETAGTIRSRRALSNRSCVGVKFEGLSKEDEDYIHKYILEKQREVLKKYKAGELTEDSSAS